MTIRDAAAAWGISISRITKLIKQGRVKGVRMEIVNGKATWFFPPQDKPPERKSGPK